MSAMTAMEPSEGYAPAGAPEEFIRAIMDDDQEAMDAYNARVQREVDKLYEFRPLTSTFLFLLRTFRHTSATA